MAQQEKILKVIKGTYGTHKRPVFWLKVEGANTATHLDRDEPASLLFDELKAYSDAGFTIQFEES